jgi:type VI secretion system VasD/TssJ family lipoprotein
MNGVQTIGLRRASQLAGALACAAAVGGCALFGGGSGAKGGDEFKLTLTATQKLNSCGNESGNALAVRVYQLSGDAKISSASLGSLWGNEKDELGSELLDEVEVFLEPGGKTEPKIIRAPGALVLAVAGNYCKADGECWIWYGPFEKIGSHVKLTFDDVCIKEAREGKKK